MTLCSSDPVSGLQYDNTGNRLSNISTASVNQHAGNTYTANNLNQLDSVTHNSGIGSVNGPFPITYDLNGNMTDDGGNRTFEWDAANRLVAISYKDAGSRTEFAYDGLGRRVKILEYDGSTAATIEPGSSGIASQYDPRNPNGYETFTIGPFAGPAGNYTLLFQGLNPNGGTNAMLLDAVTLDGGPVANGSFERPTVEDYQYRPADMAWTYGGSTGIAAGGGTYIFRPPVADGVQSAFIEGNGSLWQTLALTSGSHSFSLRAAQAMVNETGQQVRVSLLGLPTNTKTFVWSGNTIAEERDSTGMAVTKRFFAEGEQRVGGADAGNYYYSRDHLGSIREVTNASGVVKAQFDYDVWGNQVVVTGNMSFDFGYTGFYRHAPSDLYLAKYRAYDPTMARWINRDPIGETGGLHLYAYVLNSPLNETDSFGLDSDTIEVTKSDGQFDDSNFYVHAFKHDLMNRILRQRWIDDGVSVNITFRNVCPKDHPVLVPDSARAIPSIVGHATTFPDNSARIDVHTTIATFAEAPPMSFPLNLPGRIALSQVKLHALCKKSDCNK